MNQNVNGQIPNVNPQPPVAPVAPVQPVAQPTTVAPVAPMAPVVPKKPMDKEQIFKFVGLGAGALVALSAFIPYFSVSVFGYTQKASVWDNFGALSGIILLLFGVIAAVTFFFGKAKRFSMLAAGAAFWFALSIFNSADFGFDGISFGFWMMLLGGTALLVLNVLENIEELKSIVATKPATPNAMPAAPMAPVAPVAPVVPTVAPVQPVTPVSPVVEPVVQTAVVCANCGQPKKNPADQFCQSCGQKY